MPPSARLIEYRSLIGVLRIHDEIEVNHPRKRGPSVQRLNIGLSGLFSRESETSAADGDPEKSIDEPPTTTQFKKFQSNKTGVSSGCSIAGTAGVSGG